MTCRLKSLVGLKESVVLLLIQSIKIHTPSEFTLERCSFLYCYVSQLWLLHAPNSVAWIYVKGHPYLQTCLHWHFHARRRDWACLALTLTQCCQNSIECEEMQHWCPTCTQDHGDSLLRDLCSGQKYSYSPFCRTIFCFQNSLQRGTRFFSFQRETKCIFLRSLITFWLSLLHRGLFSPGGGWWLLQMMAMPLESCRLFAMQISAGSLTNCSRSFRERRRRTWAQFEPELWSRSLSDFFACFQCNATQQHCLLLADAWLRTCTDLSSTVHSSTFDKDWLPAQAHCFQLQGESASACFRAA